MQSIKTPLKIPLKILFILSVMAVIFLPASLMPSAHATDYAITVVVQFEPNQWKVDDKYKPELEKLLPWLEKGGFHGGTIKELLIKGNADATERDPVTLSKRRAEAVKKILIQMGVRPSRLIIKGGYGNTLPIADDQTEEGRAKNRRVEFAYELAEASTYPEASSTDIYPENQLRIFFQTLQSALASNDTAKVVAMTNFPLLTDLRGSKKFIQTSAELTENFDKVFTQKFKASMAKKNYQDLFVTVQGVRVGNGMMWLNKVDAQGFYGQPEGTLKIINVNTGWH